MSSALPFQCQKLEMLTLKKKMEMVCQVKDYGG
jgi:hypothetical protein